MITLNFNLLMFVPATTTIGLLAFFHAAQTALFLLAVPKTLVNYPFS